MTRPLRVPVLGTTAPAREVPWEPPPLRVPDGWVREFRIGDHIETADSRDRKRVFHVVEVEPASAVAELNRTCYLIPESVLVWKSEGAEKDRARASGIACVPGRIRLSVGDEFTLSLDGAQGEAGSRNPVDERSWLIPPRIGLELAGVSISLRPEQRVLLDDGKIEAVILEIDGQVARARAVRAARDPVSIRAEKGVNFPDSEIVTSALSARDREVLPEVLGLADLVGISFVRQPNDVREALDSIRAAAAARQAAKLPGIIVKLETAYALQTLPELLLQAMHHHPVGVMIARGDLAVEVGFERMAELQQEILWFAEAAHLPVVWATQVLDNLARTGIPSRAEVTDASMSVQAECVMLNKGPYVADACRTLDTIIRRMEKHQFKKRNLYRSLKISLSMDPVEGRGRTRSDESQ